MKILIVEDGEYKLKKISLLLDNINNVIYDTASSYSSALKKVTDSDYDLLILDMSIPTFDKTNNDSGGRFRIFGGKDIVSHLKRKESLKPFILLTQYNKFDDNKVIKSLEDLNMEFKEKFKPYYIDTIYYDTSSTKWKVLLEEEILKLC